MHQVIERPPESVDTSYMQGEGEEPMPWGALVCRTCGDVMTYWTKARMLDGYHVFDFIVSEDGDASHMLLRYAMGYPPTRQKLDKEYHLDAGDELQVGVRL